MSILIKGMEMPPSDKALIMAYKDGRFVWIDLEGEKTYQYEAVEVPTPHGRLKDVDVIIKNECHSCDGCCEVIECDCLNCTKAGCDTIRALNDAPTIVEAEE